MHVRFAVALIMFVSILSVGAGEPQPRDDYPRAAPATADEPLLSKFSIDAAAEYLDRQAHLVERSCFACHSTYSYLPGRSAIDPLAREVMQTRVLIERYVNETSARMHERANRVLAAAELARHDAATTGQLQPITRKALDYMWTLQRSDGGITWVKVGEAPSAIDDTWGITMMAIAAGAAPDEYAQTPAAKVGIAKLQGWFRKNPAQTRQERGLALLAHAAIGGVLPDDERKGAIEAIFAEQLPDGGWSTATQAKWIRPDRKPLDAKLSDGLATGFNTFALARSGVAPTDERLRKATSWLKSNQRAGGGWFTHSPFKRNDIASNAGTSFAIQALAACGEIARPPLVSSDRFAAALAAAEQAVPKGASAPNLGN